MINKEHKDRLFTFLFGNSSHKEWTLSLYNAVSGSSYTNPDDIQITTMDDVIYMGMKNDVSFIISNMLNIFEQQSTFNPNMPVRMLMYAGRLYDKYIHLNHKNIYGHSLVHLPVPKLIVFYNGTDEREDTVLKLSSSFQPENGTPDDTAEYDIEVRVRMICINYGQNQKLMKKCQPLTEYAWFIDRIRKNTVFMDIEAAVDKALLDMPDSFLIRQCLTANRTEVKNMCITEYNEAETLKMFEAEYLAKGRREGRREGRKEGRREGRREGENRLGKLMELLLAKGLTQEAQKAAADETVRAALYEQYGITDSPIS